MKSFQDWLKEQVDMPEGHKGLMAKMIAVISNFENKDVEECKDLLFQLRDKIEDKLTGGD